MFNAAYDSKIDTLFLVDVETIGGWNPAYPIVQDWADGGSTYLLQGEQSGTVVYPASYSGVSGYSPNPFGMYAPYAKVANIPPPGASTAGTAPIPCRALNSNERVVSKATEPSESMFNSDPLFWVRDMTKYAAAQPAAPTQAATNSQIYALLLKLAANFGVTP